MKHSTMLLILVIGFLCMALQGEGSQKITIATQLFPPYVQDSSERSGWIPEVISAALESQGYHIIYQHVPFARAIRGVQEGVYDAMAPIYRTAQREEDLLFSDSLGQSRTVFVQKKGQGITFTSLLDLQPYRIGMIRDTSISPAFDQATYLTKEEANTYDQNVKKLKTDRIDLLVGNELVIMWTIHQLRDEFPQPVEVIAPPINLNHEYIGVSKQSPQAMQFVTDFNRGLSRLITDHLYEGILQKYGISYHKGVLQISPDTKSP